jgi:hypothetical protein
MPINFNSRAKVSRCSQTRASNFVRHNLSVFNEFLRKQGKPPLDLNIEDDVVWLINASIKYTHINRAIGLNDPVKPMENKVALTYTKSNLGKGYIFWFICNQCQNKVRILYMPEYSDYTLCRNCHNLQY